MNIRSKIATSILVTSLIVNSGMLTTFAYQGLSNETTEMTVENKDIIGEKLITLNNKIIVNGKGADLSSEIEKVVNLNEGTAIIRFNTSGSGIQTLFSVSNNKKTNEHFHLYINNSQVGYELRKQSGNVSVSSKGATINEGINTIAFRAENNKGYTIYVNGEKVLNIDSSTASFLQVLEDANTFNLGKTDRSSGNEYNFNGDIDFFEFYNKALSDSDLKYITGQTKAYELEFPEGVLKTNNINLFSPGYLGSNNFRIPSLFTTKNGTVLASIDVRKNGGHDSPNNIDTGIKRSTDGGSTWDEGQIILDYPGAASAIDTSMIQDNENGRIFLLVTHFAEGFGYPNCKTGSGYKEFNGNRYLLLYDKSGNEYTIREDNIVYNANNEATIYSVDENKNLYKNGALNGHILTKAGDLQVLGTAFLSLIYSDDDGVNWSEPIDLNKELKEDWMKFFGTGPGRGHQILNGKYAGRIVFPIYLTNSSGFQSSAVIYSDDNGVTWKVGETATDGRNMGNGIVGNAQTTTSGEQLTESQVVEMPNGQLKLFMRNSGNRVRIATSFDGGATWDDDVVRDEALAEPYCQLSVINYSKKVDGKDALIFSNPNAGNRSNGTVRIGLITENGTHENGEVKYEFDWKYSKVVETDYFAYSCLTELADEHGNPNGEIGLFYEGTGSTHMMFTKMNSEYLKADLLANVTPSEIVGYEFDKDEYSPLDKINLKVTFDQAVSLIGDKTITIKLGAEEIDLTFVESKNCKEFIFEGTMPEKINSGEYEVVLKGKNDLKITNVYNKLTNISNYKNTGVYINIKGNYDKLENLVNQIKDLKEYLYTNDSWSSLKINLNKAKNAIENKNLSLDELEILTNDLEYSIENLIERELKVQLRNLLDYANTIEKNMMDESLRFAEIRWYNFEVYRKEATLDLLDLQKSDLDLNRTIFTLNYFISDLELR